MAEAATKFEVGLSFIIFGFDCEPDEITEILKIAPTRIWLRNGSARVGDVESRDENGWELASPSTTPNVPLVDQIDALVAILAPHKECFSRLPRTARLKLRCIAYGYEYLPAMGLSREQIRFLAGVDAGFDLEAHLVGPWSESG